MSARAYRRWHWNTLISSHFVRMRSALCVWWRWELYTWYLQFATINNTHGHNTQQSLHSPLTHWARTEWTWLQPAGVITTLRYTQNWSNKSIHSRVCEARTHTRNGGQRRAGISEICLNANRADTRYSVGLCGHWATEYNGYAAAVAAQLKCWTEKRYTLATKQRNLQTRLAKWRITHTHWCLCASVYIWALFDDVCELFIRYAVLFCVDIR